LPLRGRSTHPTGSGSVAPGCPGRLSPALRVLLYLPVSLAAYFLAGGAALIALAQLAGPTAASLAASWGSTAMLALSIATGAAILGVTALFRAGLDRASLAGLGLRLTRSGLVHLVLGFGLGALLMGAIFLLELALSGYALKAGPGRAIAVAEIAATLVALITFLCVAVSEEVLARGYVLQTLERQWGVAVALALSSTLFGLLHLGNPSSSLFSAAALVVAGLLLGAGYLVTRDLWLAIGLHWSWNFFQGPVLGFPVSGLSGLSLLDVEPIGPEWLTGGAFGPEASLLALAVEALAAGALLHRARRLASCSADPARL
jgi:membrane protease YdiL (CAAX protease family)